MVRCVFVSCWYPKLWKLLNETSHPSHFSSLVLELSAGADVVASPLHEDGAGDTPVCLIVKHVTPGVVCTSTVVCRDRVDKAEVD